LTLAASLGNGALTLLTNYVMAWNTQRLQRAVGREGKRAAPGNLADVLGTIGPVGHKHINCFPMSDTAPGFCHQQLSCSIAALHRSGRHF
jgi:hypothetical protein